MCRFSFQCSQIKSIHAVHVILLESKFSRLSNDEHRRVNCSMYRRSLAIVCSKFVSFVQSKNSSALLLSDSSSSFNES